MTSPDANAGREVEFKFGLEGPLAFDALSAALGLAPAPAVRQENRFYDSRDGALGEARCSLRVRAEEGALTLTAKGPREAAGAAEDELVVRPEEELPLSAAEAAAVAAGTLHPLALFARRGRRSALLERIAGALGDRPLVELGRFVNHRARLGPLDLGPGLTGLVLELDRTELPGGRVDHELEVEVPAVDVAAARTALHALLARAGLAWHPVESKLARFAQALRSSSAEDP